MRGLASLLRSAAGVSSLDRADWWRAGLSVPFYGRDGVHDFVGFRRARPTAERSLSGALSYWQRGPAWSCSNVVVSYRDWELHRRRHDCRSPDCRTAVGPLADTERAAR